MSEKTRGVYNGMATSSGEKNGKKWTRYKYSLQTENGKNLSFSSFDPINELQDMEGHEIEVGIIADGNFKNWDKTPVTVLEKKEVKEKSIEEIVQDSAAITDECATWAMKIMSKVLQNMGETHKATISSNAILEATASMTMHISNNVQKNNRNG